MGNLFERMFDRKLTLEYMNEYLRRKGIATSEIHDNMFSFRLYDNNWDIIYVDVRLLIRLNFMLGKDVRMDCMTKSVNYLNHDLFGVKSYLSESQPRDEEGKIIENAESDKFISFSFEQMCFTESAFRQVYEYGIYAMMDAMDYHKKLLNKCMTEPDGNSPRIGFNSSEGKSDGVDVKKAQSQNGRVGF